MLYQRPDLLHRILDVNTRAVIAYLNAQIEVGAQAVMVFDTWGGILSHAAYREFSLSYITRIITGLKSTHDGARVPRVVFTKGGGGWLEDIADIGCEAVGLDWTVDIGAARKRVGAKVALQGNLDPAILLSSPEVIIREANAVLASYGQGSGHVFNLGHGISQHTPPENVTALIEAVRGSSGNYH
jgi:uroporphyrinogen decarboxylase